MVKIGWKVELIILVRVFNVKTRQFLFEQKRNGTLKRIKWLDGIKGIAAIGVFTHHFLLDFLQSTYSGSRVSAHISAELEYGFAQSPLSVLVNGNFWVCMFCLISGIILSL